MTYLFLLSVLSILQNFLDQIIFKRQHSSTTSKMCLVYSRRSLLSYLTGAYYMVKVPNPPKLTIQPITMDCIKFIFLQLYEFGETPISNHSPKRILFVHNQHVLVIYHVPICHLAYQG